MKKRYSTLCRKTYNISCVHYEPDSEGVEKVIIALHGFGGDKESSAVMALARAATEHKTAVVCFDFPCHGTSEADESFFTVENCINDGVAVYASVEKEYFSDGIGEGKIHFFATSFGAYILAQMLERPYFKGARAVFRSPAVKMSETFLHIIANSTVAELEKKGVVECGFDRKMYLGYDFWRDLYLHNIDHIFYENETLMIYGDKDDVVSPSDMREYGEKRPGVEVRVIEGADHRFKGKGQLDAVIDASVEFLLGC